MDHALTLIAVAKRVRIGKFKAFGDELRKWRGDMDIEVAVRGVRHLGVDFDGATLRGWEYGWTGAPDPMRLLALAHVYRKTSADVLQALAAARNITLPVDLSGHASARNSALPNGGAERVDPSRERVLEGKLLVAEAILTKVVERASNALARLRDEDDKGAKAAPRSGRRDRKNR